MIPAILRNYLATNGVQYSHTMHPYAATTLGAALKDHTPPREMAKTLILDANGVRCLAVVPANHWADLGKLKHAMGVNSLRLITENEMTELFPNMDLGAVPPLGTMFGMQVYLDAQLAREDEIAFNAGTHTDVIHMSYRQFERLAEPKVLDFASKATLETGVGA
jgi:Ala-tRNA(Pro) deacylase